MTEPQPTPWVTRTANAPDIGHRLAALKKQHRLAIHMVEIPIQIDARGQGIAHHTLASRFGVFDKTLADLAVIPSGQIDASLRAGTPRLFSMSLLPHTPSGIAMKPYNVEAGAINEYGYLFDLSQDQPHPPRVARAQDMILTSGYDVAAKRFQLHTPGQAHGNHPLDTFYDQFFDPAHPEAWEQNITAAMGGPHGGAHTQRQLDLLNQSYRTPRSPMLHDKVAPVNEIFVAASTDHIAAIVVNAYKDGKTPGVMPFELYHARTKLQAALVGLRHLEQGIDLPVVIYHVDGPLQGKLSVIGQGKEALTIAALQALKALGPSGIEQLGPRNTVIDNDSKSYASLLEAVQHTLGLDIEPGYAKADGPGGWPEAVDTQLAALKAARGPTSPLHRPSPASGGRS